MSLSSCALAAQTILKPYHLHDEIKKTLQNAILTPPPLEIILQKKIVVLGGEDLEVHFCDHHHLKEIVKQHPYFEAKNVYFIHDVNARRGLEFAAPIGEVACLQFLQIRVETSLNIEGEINPLYPVQLCHESPFFRPTGSVIPEQIEVVQNFEPPSQRQALFLARSLDPDEPYFLTEKSKEARIKLSERQVDRILNPEKYPSFEDLTPFCSMFCEGEVTCHEQNYLVPQELNPLVYLADSKEKIIELRNSFLTSSLTILYITSARQTHGIYSFTPLDLKRGFILTTKYNLGFSGIIDLEDIILSIRMSNRTLFLYLYFLKTFQTSVTASKIISGQGKNLLSHKPIKMSPQMRDSLIKYFIPN